MTAPTTRRALFGASAAAALIGAAGAGQAADLDSQLHARIAEWLALDRQVRDFPHATDGSNWQAFDALNVKHNVAAERVAGIPARTPEGLRAKARVLQTLMASYGDPDRAPIAVHTCALLRDLLGEG